MSNSLIQYYYLNTRKMNDKDFDKLIGNRLREERQFHDGDSDWQRLAARLDGASGGNAAIATGKFDTMKRWILPLLALLLLTTSGLLWGKLAHLDKTNTALMQQIQTLKPQNALFHDTVIITRTDTVFIERNAQGNSSKTTYSRIKTSNSSGSDYNLEQKGKDINKHYTPLNTTYTPPQLMTSTTILSANNAANFDREKQLLDKIADLENKLQVSENQRLATDLALKTAEGKVVQLQQEAFARTSESWEDMVTKNDKLNALVTVQSDSIKLLTEKITLDSASLKSKIDKAGPLSIITPNTIKTSRKPTTPRLFVGLGGGMINYKVMWINPQGLTVSRNEQSYQADLKLEYALTDRLRLTASGDYCPFNFEIFWQDARYNLPTPEHFYPQYERIKSSKAHQKLTQATIGTKYLLTDGTKKWRPYVGAGYSAMRILPFETEFTIQNLANPASLRTATASSKSINIANLLLLNGGLEYRFTRHFVAQGEGFYNLDLNRPRKTYDLFGVRGALLFNF